VGALADGADETAEGTLARAASTEPATRAHARVTSSTSKAEHRVTAVELEAVGWV
jgi:hypothetical protein